MNNRDYKFRAWNKVKNKMVNLRPMSVGESQGSHICFGCEEFGHSYYDCQDDNEWELMQFTGMTDKAGNEIYEGDILQHKYGNIEVIYDTDIAMVMAKRDTPTAKGAKALIESFCDDNNSIVIGNIWESPALLKDERSAK